MLEKTCPKKVLSFGNISFIKKNVEVGSKTEIIRNLTSKKAVTTGGVL